MAGDQKPISPLGGVKAFQCKGCGGQVELRAPGQSLTAVCRHCGSITDLSDENLSLIRRYREKQTRKPIIPFGRRGRFEEKEWEVIGFQVRKVTGYDYSWEEYLMFNPRYGFRWLLNQYGHWSLTKPMLDFPQIKNRIGRFEGEKYNAFSKGAAQVVYVMGEFYWSVEKGSIAQTMDWVRDGEMISRESDGKGINWTHSQYLEPKEVQAAFNEELKLPFKSGIGAHQPNISGQRFKKLLPIFLIALIGLIGMQLFFSGGARNEKIAFMEGIAIKDATKISEPFEIPGKSSNVELGLHTPDLLNHWIEVDGYFHNLETNVDYTFKLVNEYYAGYTDGESWNEGSKRNSTLINQVPPGKYELVTQFYSDTEQQKFSIDVKRDVMLGSNFLIFFLIITVPILFLGMGAYSFNKKKWAESDF